MSLYIELGVNHLKSIYNLFIERVAPPATGGRKSLLAL